MQTAFEQICNVQQQKPVVLLWSVVWRSGCGQDNLKAPRLQKGETQGAFENQAMFDGIRVDEVIGIIEARSVTLCRHCYI